MNNKKIDMTVDQFESWHETHYEIVTHINMIGSRSKIIEETHEREGNPGLYILACELTDEFEREHAGRTWDGEWWEVLDYYLTRKLK